MLTNTRRDSRYRIFSLPLADAMLTINPPGPASTTPITWPVSLAGACGDG